MDSVNADLREKGLPGEEMHSRFAWREQVRNIDPGRCRLEYLPTCSYGDVSDGYTGWELGCSLPVDTEL